MTGYGRGRLTTLPAPPWALGVLAGLLAVVALSYAELPAWAWAGALLAPVAAVALLGTYPVISLGVCAAMSIATALGMGDAVPVWSSAVAGAIFVISLLAGRRMPRPAPALSVFAVGTALDVALGLIAGDVWSVGLLLLGLTVVLPWVLGRSIRQQAELVAIAAERARLQERNRIAHDMHDTLGHELSLLALRAGALEMALDLDDRHRTAATELRAGAGLATERLAEILTVLRAGEPAPLRPVSDRIEDLVDRAARAGLAVSLEWHGVLHLPPMVDRAAHRVVREALTNAAKHAAGAAVRVRLATADGTTVVTVTNALPPHARRGTGGRAGLTGLREHVRLAGGTLRAGRRDHEFEVVATLPHMGES
ncbi:sensor histidine kinase [Sphaerisporangium perillae]|uniref:sensor histidine kinase n=1 Tax=Sphaerisporangium perillae TaxID=2935860 RepID=UPI00200D301B|nr:histidine kinase [Sphaerisporangium perillae]